MIPRLATRIILVAAVALAGLGPTASAQLGQVDLVRPKLGASGAESVAATQPGGMLAVTAEPGKDTAAAKDAGGTAGAGKHKAKVRLLTDHTALVPGQSVELAIAFEIQDGWHTYWQNPGEGPIAPTFKWQLPAGFEIGRLRYPLPKRHVDALDAVTFILEADPVLLAPLKVPADAKPGSEVTIAADGRWLVCREVCVIENGRLELKLPMVADAKDAKPANSDEFNSARSRLPLPSGKAKYLDKLAAAADVDRVQPGARFRVAVVIDVQSGYHINSSKPLIEGMIATDLFPYKVEGLSFDRPAFPPGKVAESEIGKLSEYAGRAIVVLPVEADNDLKGRDIHIGGVLTYQACSEKTNQCYPPTGAEWELTLPIAQAGEAVKPAHVELFASLPSTPASQPATAVQVSGEGGTWLQRAQLRLARLGIVGYLLMALIGGFIMNLTPCVLPVISIKILSFVQQAREGRRRIFTLGLAFGVGIEVSFLAFGGIILGLGQYLGLSQQWGGQFQSPQFVIGLAAIVLAFALSLFGVFALNPPRVVNELGGKIQQEGHLGAFGMGLLATLLGTACTAPFLSAVLAIAVRQPVTLGMLIFAAAGVGMAFPYVVLAAQPGWLKVIPKPGPWMTTFEHLFGFLLLGMVIKLLGPLAAQIGTDGLYWALVFLLLVAVAAWVYGRLGFGAPVARRLRSYATIAILIVGGWILCFMIVHTIPELAAAQKALRLGGVRGSSGESIPWVPYTPQRAMDAVKAGKTAFVDYSAEWCTDCKLNEKFVLNTSEIREALQRLGVISFKADLTSPDPEIQKDQARFGRSALPMYVVYPAGKPDEPILLDEVLTPSALRTSLLAALEKAGASKPTQSAPAQ